MRSPEQLSDAFPEVKQLSARHVGVMYVLRDVPCHLPDTMRVTLQIKKRARSQKFEPGLNGVTAAWVGDARGAEVALPRKREWHPLKWPQLLTMTRPAIASMLLDLKVAPTLQAAHSALILRCSQQARPAEARHPRPPEAAGWEGEASFQRGLQSFREQKNDRVPLLLQANAHTFHLGGHAPTLPLLTALRTARGEHYSVRAVEAPAGCLTVHYRGEAARDRTLQDALDDLLSADMERRLARLSGLVPTPDATAELYLHARFLSLATGLELHSLRLAGSADHEEVQRKRPRGAV